MCGDTGGSAVVIETTALGGRMRPDGGGAWESTERCEDVEGGSTFEPEWSEDRGGGVSGVEAGGGEDSGVGGGGAR